MRSPITWFFEKYLKKYNYYEPFIRLILDMLFISTFIWFGLVLQPQIIYICNETNINYSAFIVKNVTYINLGNITP